jgi:hypothetical protein
MVLQRLGEMEANAEEWMKMSSIGDGQYTSSTNLQVPSRFIGLCIGLFLTDCL